MDSRFASFCFAKCLLKPLRGNDGRGVWFFVGGACSPEARLLSLVTLCSRLQAAFISTWCRSAFKIAIGMVFIDTLLARNKLRFYKMLARLPELPPRFFSSQTVVATCRCRSSGTCYFEFSAAFFKPAKPLSNTPVIKLTAVSSSWPAGIGGFNL